MNKMEVDIFYGCPEWPAFEPLINKVVKKTLEMSGYLKNHDHPELSIVLADNAFVQDLNRQYRQKDKPTNVLSFPAEDPVLLGDVVLAYETVKKEAEEQEKKLEHHVMHLIIHGILHLIGYDHESEQEAQSMESLEIKILESFGIKSPY